MIENPENYGEAQIIVKNNKDSTQKVDSRLKGIRGLFVAGLCAEIVKSFGFNFDKYDSFIDMTLDSYTDFAELFPSFVNISLSKRNKEGNQQQYKIPEENMNKGRSR